MQKSTPSDQQKQSGVGIVPILKQHVLGLIEDFWADGEENLLKLDFGHSTTKKSAPRHQPLSTQPTVAADNRTKASSAPTWHAEPGEISEKMWGEGQVTPGGQVIDATLIKPLGLTREMSVLDLSAGLGGRMRRTTEETGAYFTGLEPDAEIAKRGMELSVRAGKAKHAPVVSYDPSKLSLTRPYDCILARETFYRVPDQAAFFEAIAANTKPRAQLAFTDYIVDAEHRQNPNVLAWYNNEKLAKPMGLVEAAQAWAKVGFTLRVHEDLSDFYKVEVKAGLNRLMRFLGSGIQPDKETAASLLRRIETWQFRIGAMEQGMKFYRFYGTKN